jgi:prepilin-type N-terminal cleavage/methylation domain-containing protein
MNYKKGFTLLELLVVVAIIGVLSTIVLVSLSDSRIRAADAGVKSNLRNAVSQAEIFYNTNTAAPSSYASVCTNGDGGGTLGANGIGLHVLTAAKNIGLSSYATNGTGTLATATCNDNANSWAAEVPLRADGQMWCVDSSGKSKQENSTIGTGTVCP